MNDEIKSATTVPPYKPNERQKALIAAADALAVQTSQVARRAPNELVRRMTQEVTCTLAPHAQTDKKDVSIH